VTIERTFVTKEEKVESRWGGAPSCPQGLGLNGPIGPFKPSIRKFHNQKFTVKARTKETSIIEYFDVNISISSENVDSNWSKPKAKFEDLQRSNVHLVAGAQFTLNSASGTSHMKVMHALYVNNVQGTNGTYNFFCINSWGFWNLPEPILKPEDIVSLHYISLTHKEMKRTHQGQSSIKGMLKERSRPTAASSVPLPLHDSFVYQTAAAGGSGIKRKISDRNSEDENYDEENNENEDTLLAKFTSSDPKRKLEEKSNVEEKNEKVPSSNPESNNSTSANKIENESTSTLQALQNISQIDEIFYDGMDGY